jgi:hypothetical protein
MTAKTELSAPKRRTRAEVQELVAEFVSRGMRRSEFCRSRGLSFSTLDRHLKKRRGELPSAASPGARLLFHDSPRACRSPDQVPPRPYSRRVGQPAFIASGDMGFEDSLLTTDIFRTYILRHSIGKASLQPAGCIDDATQGDRLIDATDPKDFVSLTTVQSQLTPS